MSFCSAPKTVGSGVREAATRALSREGGLASRSGVAARLLAWALSGGVASKAAVLVTTFSAARSLAPRQFGEYAGLCATTQLAAGIWDMGVASLLTYEYASSSMLNARLRFRESSAATAIGRWVTAAVSLAGLPAIALIRGPVAFAAAVLAGEAATMGASWLAAALLLKARGRSRSAPGGNRRAGSGGREGRGGSRSSTRASIRRQRHPRRAL